ncbi:hypothetical protein [Desertivirga arenae]|uniref:hypothetical protein n=1 Tax=Desertivirga arenae TaxID=2810309 RepID=UPI001A9649F6|nr:hypothetical protein [Pedobacter sp. SYSU D00823]
MKFKQIFIPITIVAFLCSAILVAYLSNYVFPWQYQESIKATLAMGGLSSLPDYAEDIEIEKRGSPFTRQFIIEFRSTPIEIEKWIKNSKRLKTNKPRIVGETKVYEILPGENGAAGGRVEVTGNKVLINMSWS